jgi:hypothetical protein
MGNYLISRNTGQSQGGSSTEQRRVFYRTVGELKGHVWRFFEERVWHIKV